MIKKGKNKKSDIIMKNTILALLRICMGWIFFWPFLDKLFGLGFATEAGKSWLGGVSPTTGFLTFGSYGPLKPFFENLGGQAWVDWMFMMGLLLLGLSLILGIGMRLAAYGGTILMLLMWLALLPPKNNPFLDDHIIYALVIISLYHLNAGEFFGLGKWWRETKLVQKYPILK
jgi:thiosulfate dehydrogenase (quinone) large subunit